MLILDFDKVCRLCLTKGENMVSIFGDHAKCEPRICDRIQNYTCLKPTKSDGLPDAICSECLSKLDLIKEFQEQCKRSDTVLRNQLQAVGEDVGDGDIFCSKQEENLESLERNSMGKDEGRVISRTVSSNELTFHEDLQPNPNKCNSFGSRTNFSAHEQEPGLSHKQTDCDNQSKRLRSGPRKSKKVKSVSPIITSSNDNQENSMDFDDHEYAWPGSLSDEEFERNRSLDASKRLESDKSDTSSNQKRKGKVYECEYCCRTFSRSNHLVQHELTHTKAKPFHCSYCDKGFWYKNSLIGHIKQTHTGDVNFTCEECGRGFFQRSEFMRHLPTHSNETPFKCDECGMNFKLMKNLRRHQKVHTATRTHTCHFCAKSFRMLQTLKVHLITHSGEKPFKCTHCGKGFSQSAPLKAHIRSMHTGEKPYVCSMCGDAFPTGNTLKAHVFKHTGIHPYSCSACSVVFRRKKDLTDHCDVIHGGFVTSPMKVPPQLPLQDQDDMQQSTSNPALQQPMQLQVPLSGPAAQPKLEPITCHYMDAQQNVMSKTDHGISDDSLTGDPLCCDLMLSNEKPEVLEICPPLSSHLMSTLMTVTSADELINTDCLPFS